MVGSVQPTQNLSGIQTGTFSKRSRNDLEGFPVLLDGVLKKTGSLFTMGNDALDELHLGRTGTRYEASISCDGLDNIDTIVNGTL